MILPRKMGYAECNIMESRTGSVSSGLGCSPGKGGKTLKSSPFCPRSSSKLTQSIVKDHMIAHYKKVYSAKAAIDASVPKSLIHSVKYNDQIRETRLRKGGRPQSAHALSQGTSRSSCSSAQSRLSAQYDDSAFLYSRSSMVSSPRFSTSFHAKEVVYPPYKVGSRSHFHHTRPASEVKYRSPEATSRRKQSACSLPASGDPSCYKSFQDPVQKTYSGDLLQKHSQHFTQDKPFTPKTLKSDKDSYLSKYRYYRSPHRKPTQDCTPSRLMRQETYPDGSTKNKEHMQELYEPSQGFNNTEQELSEDEFNGTYSSASRQHSRANKSRDRDFFDSSSRVSPEGWKSPTMKNVAAEEEELMYLEFISAVTEDILSRGHISDRVLDRVIKRHIDMNQHHLDERKMRHLLEVLRKDFEEPVNLLTCSTESEKKENGLIDALVPHAESAEKPKKESDDSFPYASLIKYCDSPDLGDPIMVSTPVRSPERAPSPTDTNVRDGEDGSLEKGTTSEVSDNAGTTEEGSHQSEIDRTATNEVSGEDHEYTAMSGDRGFPPDQAEGDGHSEELEELGRNFSSLNVTADNAETTEQHSNTAASESDDEF